MQSQQVLAQQSTASAIGSRANEGLSLADLDTGKASILHALFAPLPRAKLTVIRSYVVPYLVVALLFYVVPLIIVFLSKPPATQPNLTYLRDVNGLLMCVVSLPILICLLLTERALIPARIAEVERKGKPWTTWTGATQFVAVWEKRYAYVNVVGQLLGILMAVVWTRVNYDVILGQVRSTWQDDYGRISSTGWLFFFFQAPVFFFTLTLYSIRAGATVFLLVNFAKAAPIKVDPFHHDRCSGLRAVGRVGLRNQYVLAAMGLNILGYIYVDQIAVPQKGVLLPDVADYRMPAAILSYLLLGPVVFLGPLLPFRQKMLQAKEREKRRASLRLRKFYRGYISGRSPIGDAITELECAQKVMKVVDRIPVWPFDTATFRRFFVAYVSPMTAVLVSTLGEQACALAKRAFMR